MNPFFHFQIPLTFNFCSSFFLFPQNVYSLDATLVWDPISEENLAGYRIFYREDGQSYDYEEPAWEGSESTCTIYNLNDKTIYYFVARAFDSVGSESGNSNETYYQPPENASPIADAGSDQTVNEGDTVTLNGSNSSDPDGAIAAYRTAQLKFGLGNIWFFPYFLTCLISLSSSFMSIAFQDVRVS